MQTCSRIQLQEMRPCVLHSTTSVLLVFGFNPVLRQVSQASFLPTHRPVFLAGLDDSVDFVVKYLPVNTVLSDCHKLHCVVLRPTCWCVLNCKHFKEHSDALWCVARLQRVVHSWSVLL